MSASLPVGSAPEAGRSNGLKGTGATTISGGAVWMIDAAQQAHVHRTQNAGQPLSGVDSLVPIGQVWHHERADAAGVRHKHIEHGG
jgi:hypothetical protein